MSQATAGKGRAGTWFGGQPAILKPLDADAAVEHLADLVAEAREAGLDKLAAALTGQGAVSDFLAAVFDLSPYLRDSVRRRPGILDALRETTAAHRIETLLAEIAALADDPDMTEARLMAGLRRLKTETHVLIALCDLARVADTQTTVRRLSALADAAIGTAVSFLLREAHG